MEPFRDITEGRSKKLLSFDALDLSLLPNIYQPWLQTDVLWNNNNFIPDKKYYYEFVIQSKSDDHDEVPTEDATHTVCYICNTAVPKAYVNEHVNSLKHIAFQKIAETGLERASKHKQMVGTERLQDNLEYFCEHCVAIIYLSNRNEHEKSKRHKNFAAIDAFLNNFALLYTNNEIDVMESLSDCKDSNDISLLKVCKAPKNSEEQNTDFEVMPYKTNNETALEDTSELEIKLKDSKTLIDNIKSCLDNVNSEMNNNVIQDIYEKADVVDSIDSYIKYLRAYGEVKLYNLGSLNQDKIKIETAKSDELVVSTFNFHGLRKFGRYLQCKLCECFIDNLQNHRLHEKHVMIVAQPLKDKHCIRYIQGRFSHCVLCNEVTDNVIVHTQFYKHIKKLERALVSTENNEESSKAVNTDANDGSTTKNTEVDVHELPNPEPNTTQEIKEDTNIKASSDTIKSLSENQYYCSVCNTQMHVNNKESHLNGTKHKANTSSAIYYLMDKGKDKKITCKVCDVSINYYTWAIQDHVASVNHIANYNNCLATNKIDKTGDSFFCKPCGLKVFKMNELSHIESQSHKVKLASYNINIIERNNQVKDIEDKLVEVNADDGAPAKIVEESTEIHRSVADSVKVTHDSNDKEILRNLGKIVNEADTGSFNEETNNRDTQTKNENYPHDPSLYECDACNEEIPNNLSHIKVHNESVKHKTMDVLLTGVNKLLEELLKYFNSPPEIHSHLQLTDVENVLNCIVCADKVTNKDTEKHTNSLKHIHNHRNLMNTNKLKLKRDKYVCYACNVYVEAGKELRHIDTVEHERRMESLKNGDYVLITADNKKLIDNIQQVLKSMETESNKPKLITLGDFIPNNTTSAARNVRNHYVDLIDNKKQLICLLCQVLVENTENQYQVHASDVNHDINYKTVMAYNQIFQIEKGYVCGFCECIISDEFAHISNEKHIAGQKTYPKKNYCFTCKINTDVGLREHVTSKEHIKNIGEPTHFYCNVCNLQIAFKTNIERHNKGFEHQNNSSLIDENKVIILKNKKCSCQVCDTTFSRDDFEDHVNSLNHVMLLHHNYYRATDSCLNLQE